MKSLNCANSEGTTIYRGLAMIRKIFSIDHLCRAHQETLAKASVVHGLFQKLALSVTIDHTTDGRRRTTSFIFNIETGEKLPVVF